MGRKNEPFDYGDVPITKLPAGKAIGADDLARWAHRRTLGRSGTGKEQVRAVKLKCKFCGNISEVLGVRRGMANRVRGDFECRGCGEKGVKIIRSKRIKDLNK